MHCLEINMIKYISLSSVIARKLNFQKLLLKNNAFWVVTLIALKRRFVETYATCIYIAKYSTVLTHICVNTYISVDTYCTVLLPIGTSLQNCRNCSCIYFLFIERIRQRLSSHFLCPVRLSLQLFFELWAEIFCVKMFPYEDSEIVSVCLSIERY